MIQKYRTKFLVMLFLLATAPLYAQKLNFFPPRGFFEEPFELTITAPVENATIWYTLNGKDPLTAGSAMSGPSPLTLTVDPDNFDNRDRAPAVCVRAIAVANDTVASNLNTHTFIFVDKINANSPDGQRPGAEWPTPGFSINGQRMDYGMDPAVYNDPAYRNKMRAAMTDIPSMSMVMDLNDLFDPTVGIFVNAIERGDAWERPCSLELINPDGSDGFHINCGVRIRGGYSRIGSNPKHAFRYFFSSDYGEPQLEHPLFADEGVDEFDKIDLRTSQNYSWAYGAGGQGRGAEANTMLRDVFSRDLQRDMGQPYTRSRYYHLFINGTYWGLFQTQERSDARYAESYFDGDPSEYDVIKVDAGYGRPYIIEATDGTLDTWNALWSIAKDGMGDKATFNRVQGLNPDGTRNPEYPQYVDLDNLMDYMINSYFVGDFDAPISQFLGNDRPNNFWGSYNRVNPNGFKFYRHDAEHTLFSLDEDRTGPFPAGERQEHFNPQWLHQQLTANAEYRLLFADRVYRHFFDDGAVTPEKNVARLMTRKNAIDNAIIAESARWGDALRDRPYTRDDEWLDQVDYLINDYFPVRTDIVLDQFIDKGWYPNFNPPTFNTENGHVDKGFQLTITAPAGTIYYTDDGAPVYGQLDGEGAQMTTVVPWQANKRVLVPTQDIGRAWFTDNDFDDSDWSLVSGAPGGIGYEKGSGYADYISFDVAQYMHQDDTNTPNSSCYVRIPFELTSENLQGLSILRAQLRYDDGFILYLNGRRVAEAMAPGSTAWNAAATENHEADNVETFDLSNYINALDVGENILAIHGLNVSFSSSDFLIYAQLQAGYEDEPSGHIISPTAKEYTGPISINKTTKIKARVLPGGQWSALNQVLLSVDEDMSGLAATEIHYHPLPEGQGDERIDGDLFEFFEIKNLAGAPINLTGASFVRGIKYDFPAGRSLAPGDFYVVCSSAEHFKSRYAFDADGQYSGNLSNGGERIVLLSATGDTILNFEYDDEPPWPIEADSTGQSLVAKVRRPVTSPSDPDYWTVSAAIHGSPHADDLASFVSHRSTTPLTQYRLPQNYPNPFNSSTKICFRASRDGHVQISVYNAIGQRVKILADRFFDAGTHSITWDAAEHAGGVYFARLRAGAIQKTVKILLLK
jgi:hypothetical protein